MISAVKWFYIVITDEATENPCLDLVLVTTYCYCCCFLTDRGFAFASSLEMWPKLSKWCLGGLCQGLEMNHYHVYI